MKQKLLFEQKLNAPINEVWDFFSDAKNLEKLTPPEMNMRLLTNLKESNIHENMEIAYKVSPILSIPLYWQTKILTVKHQELFVDIQKKGPFKLWQHTHYFKRVDKHVLMVDEVVFQLPFGILGNLFLPLVKSKLEELFTFRKAICDDIFNKNGDILIK